MRARTVFLLVRPDDNGNQSAANGTDEEDDADENACQD
jgi:hypothetical protein